jgi:DMSO/TMAO reductase YedYZ molybdopterin-dependent catalytic subunit
MKSDQPVSGSPNTFPLLTRLSPLFLSLPVGLVAGLISVVCMLTLRLAGGIPTPIELFGTFVLKHLSAPRFVDMLIFFSPNSKAAPLGLTLLAMVLLGILIAPLYVQLVRLPLPVDGLRPGRREWLCMLLLGVCLTLLGTGLFWNELAQNFRGLPAEWARLLSACALLLDFEAYALSLGCCYRVLLPRRFQEGEAHALQSRRMLLASSGLIGLGIGCLGATAGLIYSLWRSYASYDGMKTYPSGGVTSPVTPNDQHYVVTQNPIDPTPFLSVWRLEVGGLVAIPGISTYEEFIALPSISRAITLECIANGSGDHLISTAIWQGVRLRTLLDKHGGAQAGARYVAFASVDGYTVSLPLAEVLAVDALLAFRMNGVQLPMRHGFPVRVLIPGRYGEENPKWLTRVDLTDHFVGGLYADQGWYNGPLHTITRIDRPDGRLALTQTIEVGGLAFAGNRGIRRVEVSFDDGANWQDAQLAPPLSQDAWVLWTYQWHPAVRGRYMLLARATDGSGQVQTSQRQGTVPNGATGYHQKIVTLV